MPGSHSYGGRWGWGSGLGPPCFIGKGNTGSKKLTQDAMQHECNEMLFVSEQYRLSKRNEALEPNVSTTCFHVFGSVTVYHVLVYEYGTQQPKEPPKVRTKTTQRGHLYR